MHITTISVFSLSLILSACGDDNGPDTQTEDPGQHACEQVGAAGTPISAATDQAAAPVLALSETPYSVSLPTQAAGYLKLEGPAEALLFIDTATVATGLFHDGHAESELPTAAPNELCADKIPEHFDLDLHEPGSFTLKLGPSAIDKVWLMYISASGHAH